MRRHLRIDLLDFVRQHDRDGLFIHLLIPARIATRGVRQARCHERVLSGLGSVVTLRVKEPIWKKLPRPSRSHLLDWWRVRILREWGLRVAGIVVRESRYLLRPHHWSFLLCYLTESWGWLIPSEPPHRRLLRLIAQLDKLVVAKLLKVLDRGWRGTRVRPRK